MNTGARYLMQAFIVLAFCGIPAAPAVAAPKVVATILPVHSLVAGVMKGVAEPDLLFDAALSPHGMPLRPSQMRALGDADIVVRIAPQFETALVRPLARLRPGVRVLTLAGAPAVIVLPRRSGADAAALGPGRDWHIWLSPDNAVAMIAAIAATLAAADPENSEAYRRNADRLSARVHRLDARLSAKFRAAHKAPFVVFHDAYQYLERHYGLARPGIVVITPEAGAGARTIRALRQRIGKGQVRCVFSEPQFSSRLVRALVEGTDARSASLDPIGRGVPAGPDAYFTLMSALADTMNSCLAKSR